MENAEIDFDANIQRGFVWDAVRSSNLIQTILMEWPTGVLYFNKTSDGKYECLDGKQRSHALLNFVKGGHKLHKNTKSVIDREGNRVEIAKLKFDALPEEFQDTIKQYGLLIYSFDDMSIDNKVEFFTRINLGNPVTAADISRIKVKSRKLFQELSEHEAMKLGVTDKAKAKFADEDIVKSIWVVCYNENKSLLDKDTSLLLESIDVTEEQKNELVKILKYMEVFLKRIQGDKETKKMAAKMRAKTHLVSLGYMAFLAIQKNMSEDDYAIKHLSFSIPKIENRASTKSITWRA